MTDTTSDLSQMTERELIARARSLNLLTEPSGYAANHWMQADGLNRYELEIARRIESGEWETAA